MLVPFFYVVGMGILSLLALIAATGCILPLNKLGPISRFVLASLLIASANTFLAFITWSLRIGFTPLLFTVVYCGIVLSGIALRQRFFPNQPLASWHIPLDDFMAVLLAAVCFLVVAMPLGYKHDTAAIERIFSNRDDAIVHLGIVNAIDNNHNYLMGNTFYTANEVVERMTAYPQGWHINVSLVAQFTKPRHSKAISGTRAAETTYLMAALWLAGLVYMLVLLGYRVAARLKSSLAATTLATLFVLGVVFINLLFPLFVWGFYPQIAALALLFAAFVLLIESEGRPFRERGLFSLLSVLCCVGISFIWFYLWPVAVAAVYVVAIAMTRPKKFGLFVFPRYYLGLLVGGIISCIPIGLNLIYFHNADQLTAGGATVEFNNLTILALVSIATAYLLSKSLTATRIVGVGLALGVIFSLAVMTQQLLATHQLAYYYFKSTYTVVLLVCIVFICIISESITNLQRQIGVRAIRVLFLGLLGVASIALALIPRPIDLQLYLLGQPYGMSPVKAVALADALQQPIDPTGIVLLGSCSSFYDGRAMRLAMALSGRATPQERLITETLFYPNHEMMAFGLIKDYLTQDPKKKLVILSSSQNLSNDLTAYLADQAGRIQIIQIEKEGDSERTQATCPALLH